MAKIKLTKGELKKQRDLLKQFQRYLPTLLLKKQQLQVKILEVRRLIDQQQDAISQLEQKLNVWIGLLADPQLGEIDLKLWVVPTEIKTDTVNIAGLALPVLRQLRFREADYDYYTTPFWVDLAIIQLRDYFKLVVQAHILKQQLILLEGQLRITTQRVNLFEKVKIPESLENIRKIRIYLGDQMTNAVGICKVAKAKILQAA